MPVARRERWVLKLDVPGEFCEPTRFVNRGHPPDVVHPRLVLAGWRHECIVEVFPCFFVTRPAREAIRAAEFSGLAIEEVPVPIVIEEEWELAMGAAVPPDLFRVRVDGGDEDDFSLHCLNLVVSTRVLVTLRGIGLESTSFSPFDDWK